MDAAPDFDALRAQRNATVQEHLQKMADECDEAETTDETTNLADVHDILLVQYKPPCLYCSCIIITHCG
jgi:hypothetical protein